eukprot:COSAG02_NODE_867_length_16363_cov_3.359137_10_plen_38_part_00
MRVLNIVYNILYVCRSIPARACLAPLPPTETVLPNAR